MDLSHIVYRIAEGFPRLDANDVGGRANRRTGLPYLSGLKTMTELEVTAGLKDWWETEHPEDLGRRLILGDQEAYPGSEGAERCDLVFREIATGRPIWAIELKHIALVGDNGKTNDYGVAKMLSPYLKDRSLLHDALRLSSSGFGCEGAVIVYSFSYSEDSVRQARVRHPAEQQRIDNLDSVRRRADPSGEYSIDPMLELADHMLRRRGLVTAQARAGFSAWGHPLGGEGVVAGWAIAMRS